MTAREANELMPLSEICQAHSLLVGQKLDGWPQVRPVDAEGVTVLGVEVRFDASGGAAFDGDAPVLVSTNRAGRANAKGLRGVAAGPAIVTVSIPSAPGVTPLEYQVEVVAAAGPEVVAGSTKA